MGEDFEQFAVKYHLILALPIVAVVAVKPLSVAWLRRFGTANWAALAELLGRRASNSLRLLTLCITLNWVILLLPIAPKTSGLLSDSLFVIAVLIGSRLVVRIVSVLIQAYLNNAAEGPARERAQKEYLPLASSVLVVAIGLMAAIVIAHHFGQDVTSLLTALGVGSLALGLAAQQTLSNMIAGFTLLVDRPFRPGDRIRLQSGESGVVSEIGIRSTRILLDERNLLVVPNAELVNSRVVNYAVPTSARGEVRFRLPWGRLTGSGGDIDQILQLGMELARAEPDISREPAPEAAVTSLLEGGAEIVIHFHAVDHERRVRAEQNLRRLLLKRIGPVPPFSLVAVSSRQ